MVVLNGASGATTVAVDAMGGDYAPEEVVKGAVEAHRLGVPVVLVGQREAVKPILRALGADVPLVHANDVIGMDESVAAARREDTSLRVAAELVNSGDADAVVSCGNSAAIMAIAMRVWDVMPGIDRPAFGSYLPARNGGVFVLDIGANSSVRANNLVQFAVMGDVYVKVSRGIESPTIALLSNGSEDSKGTKEIKEANAALRKLDLNFIGNVEGNHVFENRADVVVCDGFAGNVLLKGGEGIVAEVFDLLKEEMNRDLFSKLAAAALMPAFTRIKRRVDYETYGGAPVLGVNEVMVNCHGRSRHRAVTNAIRLAERLAHEHLVDRISAEIEHDEVEVGRSRKLARAFRRRHEV